jgi:hypothetical protein
MMRRLLASLVIILLLASPALGSTIYMSGFELGTAGVAGGDYAVAGGITVQSTIVHSGNYASKNTSTLAHLVSSGFGTGNSAISTSTISCRFYAYFAGTPTVSANTTQDYTTVAGVVVGMRTLLVDSGGSNFRMQISGTFGGFSTTTGTTPIVANTWYRIDTIYDAASGGVGKVYVNGVLDINTTHTGTNAAVDRISISGVNSAGQEHYYDDFFCTDTLNLGPNGKVIVRQGKAGSPTDTGFTLTSCSTIDECWSETPVGTTKVAANASSASAVAQTMLEHEFSTTQTGHGSEVLVSSSTINGVQIMCQAATSSTSSGRAAGNIRKYVNGAGPTDTAITLTLAYLVHKSAVFTDTVPNLDQYEIGWKKDASALAGVHTVADCWMQVDFTTGGGIQRKVIQD